MEEEKSCLQSSTDILSYVPFYQSLIFLFSPRCWPRIFQYYFWIYWKTSQYKCFLMRKQQQLGENKKIRLWSIGNSYVNLFRSLTKKNLCITLKKELFSAHLLISLHGCIYKIKQKKIARDFYTSCIKHYICTWMITFFFYLFLDRVVSSQNFKPEHSWNQAKINQFWRWQQQ